MSDHEQNHLQDSEPVENSTSSASDSHVSPEPTDNSVDARPDSDNLAEPSSERDDPAPPPSPAVDPTATTPDLGDDNQDSSVDLEQTREDLENSETDLFDPRPEPASMTITISDHGVETESESPATPESVTSVQSLNDDDLNRLRRVLDEENARRGLSARANRPFAHLDTDSLSILYQQVRAELGSR